MWARSHTSGLISAECAVSTSASESGATSASVRSRASVRSAAADGCETLVRGGHRRKRYPIGSARLAIQARGRPARRHTSTTSRTDAVRHEMRESSGRTTSSKRPVSSCSSSVTSAWKRRPFLSTSTMSPAPMPFEVARSRPVGGAGRRRDVDQGGLGLCHRAPEARRPPGRTRRPPSQTSRCSAHVGLALGADRDDRGAVGGQRAPERGPEALEVRRRARSRSRRAPRRGRSRARAGSRRART